MGVKFKFEHIPKCIRFCLHSILKLKNLRKMLKPRWQKQTHSCRSSHLWLSAIRVRQAVQLEQNIKAASSRFSRNWSNMFSLQQLACGILCYIYSWILHFIKSSTNDQANSWGKVLWDLFNRKVLSLDQEVPQLQILGIWKNTEEE